MRTVILLAAVCIACQTKTTRPDRSIDRAASRTATGDSTAVVLNGPTIIAFFPAVTQAQVDSSEELSTVLDDFDYHLASARLSLRSLGFQVVERPRGSIRLLNGTSSREVSPASDSADVGYVFAAPGRPALISYGVMTDSDLIDAARAFLGLQSRPPATSKL